MKQGVRIEQLLHWRLALAEREAPPPPRAAELLEALRPWWERWPERWRDRVARLTAMPIALGFAKTPGERAGGYPVPAIVGGSEDRERYARVLYLAVRAGRVRLRFTLDDDTGTTHATVETTLVDADNGAPLVWAIAERAQTGEYRLEAALPAELREAWGALKVTDRMPFRFILEPHAPDASA